VTEGHVTPKGAPLSGVCWWIVFVDVFDSCFIVVLLFTID